MIPAFRCIALRLRRRGSPAAAFMAVFMAATAHPTFAQQVLPLYERAIPNSIAAPDEEATRDPSEAYPFLVDISRPTMTAYLPAARDARRAAVIILPGGSYRGISIVKEGHDVAQAFNDMGVAAFVVKYRTPSERHMKDRARGPLQDAQQAIHVARQRAAEWKIDPARLGVVGFSAGGHLAASAGTHFDRPVLAEWKNENLRPDFLVLIYPVISFDDDITHRMSREMLLGPAPPQPMIRLYSNELAVTDATPPAFIVHAADDSSVPVANSIRFFEALQAHGVRAELVVYPAGGHGFGLNNSTTTDRWIDRCRQWLLSEGWISGLRENQ